MLPDGKSIVLERQQGAVAQGFSGLEDEVDYHWWDLAKAAALSTLLSVGAELGSDRDESDLVRASRRGSQDSINNTGQQLVRRQLNIRPTLTVRQAFRNIRANQLSVPRLQESRDVWAPSQKL